MSYDSEEILKYFAERHKIEYPLLASWMLSMIAAPGAQVYKPIKLLIEAVPQMELNRF
jgi:peroxiredoxin